MISDMVNTESPRTGYGTWQHAYILLPILVVYLLLASYGLDHQSLWKDELLSIRDAASATTIWQKGQGPLHFALLHAWMNLAQSGAGLRTLSVLIGACAVCLFYVTAATLFNRRVAWLGTLIFATSPFVIWYSQEVRYIILMLATALLATYTFRRLVPHGGVVQWFAYGVAVILAIASFVSNVFLPLAHGLYLLWSPSKRRLFGAWLLCMVLAAIPVGVWASNNYFKKAKASPTIAGPQTASIDLKKLSRRAAGARPFSPVILPYTFFTFSAGFSQGPSVHDLHQSRSFAVVKPYLGALVSLSVLFGVLFGVGLVAIWRQPDVAKLLILWMVVPLCGVLAMAFLLTKLGFNVRYVAMVLPVYLMIVASGIAWFRRLAVQLVLLAAVLCSNGLALANYYTNPYYARADVRAAVRYLSEVRQARDVFLVVGSSAAFAYYAKDNLPFAQVTARNVDDADLRADLQEIAQDAQRLWAIEIRPWEKDPKGHVKKALDDMYEHLGELSFPGVLIRRYHVAP